MYAKTKRSATGNWKLLFNVHFFGHSDLWRLFFFKVNETQQEEVKVHNKNTGYNFWSTKKRKKKKT